MISRVAEHCLWMSRYLERAENTARILEVNQTLLLDFDVPLEQQWKPLLIISGIHDMPGRRTRCRGGAELPHLGAEQPQQHRLVGCRPPPARTPGSSARSSAPTCGSGLTFYLLAAKPPGRNLYDQDRTDFYNQIKRINQLFDGITDGTMFHARPGIIQLGKYLMDGPFAKPRTSWM